MAQAGDDPVRGRSDADNATLRLRSRGRASRLDHRAVDRVGDVGSCRRAGNADNIVAVLRGRIFACDQYRKCIIAMLGRAPPSRRAASGRRIIAIVVIWMQGVIKEDVKRGLGVETSEPFDIAVDYVMQFCPVRADQQQR